MPIVFCSIELYLPFCHSLKEKRNVLRKAVERSRQRSSFSIAEIGHQDLWQRARLGAVSIGPDQRKLEAMAEKVVRDIETVVGMDATRYEIEIIDYE
ncbi:MAG TPA: DUF503 domain-containing protein [Acidobacteriota bacterium]|nr:DUF503 domain-containing protein [Acidobacteriota bacterium]